MNTAKDRSSRNVAQMKISAIKEMALRSAKVDGAVSLAWGLPSFRTPEHIRQAVSGALESDRDIGKYALPDGLPKLREAVAKNYLERTGVTVDPGGAFGPKGEHHVRLAAHFGI